MFTLQKIFSVDYQDPEEIDHLRKLEKPIMPFTILISVMALMYMYITPEYRKYFPYILVISIIENIIEFLYQKYIVQTKYFNRKTFNLGLIHSAVMTLTAILFTGGFSSPFFFSFYLVVIGASINTLQAAVMMCVFLITLVALGTVIGPGMLDVIHQDPFRAFVMIISPAFIIYIMTIIIKEISTQKQHRKEAEQFSKLLTVEKAKLETIIENIDDSIIACDVDGKIVLVTDQIATINKFRKIDIIGKNFSQIFPDLEVDLIDTLQEISLTSDAITNDFTVKIKRLVDNRGEYLGKVIILHNITKEKELERMKLDFVSMAAHELRTPLTSIRGYLSVLIEEKVRQDQEKYVHRIQIASDQLVSLVENLLNITKIENGAMTVNLQPQNWQKIVLNAVDLLRERAVQKGITLTVNEPLQPVSNVLVDVVRIPEVVMNLLANAIAYTKEGGSVTISFEEKEGKVITHIADTGEGIPPEALPHMFKKFFRVSGVLEQGSKGTGLGLFITKAIIDMHQGKIWIDSEVGKGSTFSFSLPTANK